MSQLPVAQSDRYPAIVEALLAELCVTLGTPGKRGFGASALCVDGKIFAMLAVGERLVVKLPKWIRAIRGERSR